MTKKIASKAKTKKDGKGKPQSEPPKEKKPRGHPASITDHKRSLFLTSIAAGKTIVEACDEAEISESAYKRLKLKSAQFRTEIDVARRKLVIMARSKLAAAIEAGDMATVRWYLERKVPEEFRPQFGDDGTPPGLPPGTVIVLPGSKPHPRIVPA